TGSRCRPRDIGRSGSRRSASASPALPHGSSHTTKRMTELAGRVAMVTGGAGRLGRAISVELAHAGAAVGIVDARADAAAAVVAASSARAGGANYTVSKSAVNLLTHVLAIELGPHRIRVNAVAPGLILDEVLRDGGAEDSEYVRLMLRGTPLRRTGSPEDIAP